MIPALRAADRSALYKPFDDKLQQLYENCLKRGAEYWLLSAYRSWADQAAEYAKGRTVLKDSAGNPQGKVTNAPPGYSPHQYRVAVDSCRNFNPGGSLRPCWAIQKPEHYRVWAEEAVKLGLEAGLNWKFSDPPHAQLPLTAHGLTWKILIDAHTQGGDLAVLELLNKHGPW